MEPQGWHHDPYGVHEDRYYSDGEPTKLVRDGAVEAYDEPPAGAPPQEPEPVIAEPVSDPSDLLRADGGGELAGPRQASDLQRADGDIVIPAGTSDLTQLDAAADGIPIAGS